MRWAAALGLLPFVALAGCGGGDQPEPEATEIPKAVAAQASAPVIESEFGTPVKDRVATIGLLNKRNNLVQDIQLKSGEAKRFGNVVIKLATCERSLPWEQPPETGAFVQVFVEERADAGSALAWRKVFSGWLFKNAPSLNVVEHPVYDVWVKDCAMKFPGEEEVPAAAASNAAKPSGKASGSAAPSPSSSPEAPKPAEKAEPKPSVDT